MFDLLMISLHGRIRVLIVISTINYKNKDKDKNNYKALPTVSFAFII